jgi:group I intron endonuclease
MNLQIKPISLNITINQPKCIIKNWIVYVTINLINKKKYVGQHLIYNNNYDDNYLGSGHAFKLAIKKYGKRNFKRIILEYCNKDNVDEREEYWINKLQTKDKLIGYNILKRCGGGDTLSHYVNIKNITKKLSEACKGKYWICNELLLDEKRIKIEDEIPIGYRKGRLKIEEKTKIKMSKNRKGKIVIYNKKLDIIKRINKNDEIPNGYIRGIRPFSINTLQKIKNNSTGRIWIYNITLKQEKFINKNDEIKNGWKLGRIKKLNNNNIT